MIQSRLHTFKELLEKGIWHEEGNNLGNGEYHDIDSIYIPKIQRDYAQGRESEAGVRKEFLDDLFRALEEDSQLELSFIFGSKQPLGTKDRLGFEILDGQQRLTTLFLLQWYIGMRELKPEDRMPALEKFTYETRDTSSDFINRLTHVDKTLVLSGSRHPSEIIKERKWFTDEYLCDPTATAMLGMLDAIHDKYCEFQNKDGAQAELYERLDKLKFYVLMLEKFEMADELYIKMNSRGLSLSLFENFKASLVKYLKLREVYEQNNFWFDFTTRMDATWIDLFWKSSIEATKEVKSIIEINDALIGEQYIRFFLRYFFTKSAVCGRTESAEFFYDTDNGELPERLQEWDGQYVSFFDDVPALFRTLYVIFDTFHEQQASYLSVIREDPFGNLTNFLNNLTGHNPKEYNFTLSHRAAFGALTEFIENIPEGKDIFDPVVSANFRRYCRILFNVIENTLIEGIKSVISIVKAMGEIAALPDALTSNLYESLAKNKIQSNNSQLEEEILKARQMCRNGAFDPAWESAFVRAEHHPFFKGSVGFFFEPSITSAADFDKRYEVMKDLFDGNGIAPSMRDNGHLLIRAVFSCLNTWSLLKGQRITEKAETEKFLKNTITGRQEVQDMFCGFFNQTEFNDIEKYLEDRIMKSDVALYENEETKWLFTRMTSDPLAPNLYDWITGKEGNGKNEIFRVNPYSYYINKPNKQFNYLLFNSERRWLIPKLVTDNGLDDQKAKEVWDDSIKDFTEKQITLYKTLKDSQGNDVILTILFTESLQIIFCLPVEMQGRFAREELTCKLKSWCIEVETLTFKKDTDEERKKISDVIKKWEKIVGSL